MDLTTLSFILLGTLSVILSSVLITRKFPVPAAMLLITVFVLLAGMYGLLDAHFAAVSQVIVYAGAIMVVFVFVIMLLNLAPEEIRYGRVTLSESFLILLGIVAAVMLGTKIGHGFLDGAVANAPKPTQLVFPEASGGNVKSVAATLFIRYLWPFEVVSFLIIAAMIGAIFVSKKRKADDVESA